MVKKIINETKVPIKGHIAKNRIFFLRSRIIKIITTIDEIKLVKLGIPNICSDLKYPSTDLINIFNIAEGTSSMKKTKIGIENCGY